MTCILPSRKRAQYYTTNLSPDRGDLSEQAAGDFSERRDAQLRVLHQLRKLHPDVCAAFGRNPSSRQARQVVERMWRRVLLKCVLAACRSLYCCNQMVSYYLDNVMTMMTMS